MKLSTNRSLKTAVVLGIAACAFIAQPVFASGKPSNKRVVFKGIFEEDKPAKKTKAKLKTKAFAPLNNASVKIYPDIIKRDMHVIAKDNDGNEIDFFVFDAEGTLVNHYKMKAKDHNKISGLARGTYLYRVFSGDTETATGNFEIR